MKRILRVWKLSISSEVPHKVPRAGTNEMETFNWLNRRFIWMRISLCWLMKNSPRRASICFKTVSSDIEKIILRNCLAFERILLLARALNLNENIFSWKFQDFSSGGLLTHRSINNFSLLLFQYDVIAPPIKTIFHMTHSRKVKNMEEAKKFFWQNNKIRKTFWECSLVMYWLIWNVI